MRAALIGIGPTISISTVDKSFAFEEKKTLKNEKQITATRDMFLIESEISPLQGPLPRIQM